MWNAINIGVTLHLGQLGEISTPREKAGQDSTEMMASFENGIDICLLWGKTVAPLGGFHSIGGQCIINMCVLGHWATEYHIIHLNIKLMAQFEKSICIRDDTYINSKNLFIRVIVIKSLLQLMMTTLSCISWTPDSWHLNIVSWYECVSIKCIRIELRAFDAVGKSRLWNSLFVWH